MIILTIRSDNPKAEVGLYEDDKQLGYETWEAHRELAETVHAKCKELLSQSHKTWQDITGVVVFKGPGSFTGLRIGISVANALAAANNSPIVGADGNEWIAQGLARLAQNESDQIVLPEYGAPVHITQQKR